MKLKPTLTVTVEPDYCYYGHLWQGSRSWIDPQSIRALPIGTKLYTAEQLQKEVRRAVRAAVRTERDRTNGL